MSAAGDLLSALGVRHELRVVSAHRTSALLAARIVALTDPAVSERLRAYAAEKARHDERQLQENQP